MGGTENFRSLGRDSIHPPTRENPVMIPKMSKLHIFAIVLSCFWSHHHVRRIEFFDLKSINPNDIKKIIYCCISADLNDWKLPISFNYYKSSGYKLIKEIHKSTETTSVVQDSVISNLYSTSLVFLSSLFSTSCRYQQT